MFEETTGWCDDCRGYTHMPWCPSYVPPMATIDDDDSKHKGDVMERREDEQPLTRNWNTMTRAEQIAARHEIYDRSGIPNDEYTASWWDVKELLNQHTTLVEQRDRLAAALRNLIRQLPSDERLADYNLDEAETVLATVEQGKGRES